MLRLTPAYLVCVASFYDMFELAPEGPDGRLRVHEHLVLAARRGRALRARSRTSSAATRTSTCARFECLGACEIAPMASVDGVYVGPLTEDDCERIRDDVKAGARRPRRTSSWPSARPPRSTGDRSDRNIDTILFKDIDEPGLNTLDVYPARGGYEMLKKALKMEPGAVLDEMLASRRARPRRRRLRDGPQDVLHPQGDDGQVPRLQRRRVRARDLQGPRADAEEPASAHRGDHHRRLLHRRVAARSSSSAASTTTSPTSSTRPSPRRARRASWARTSSAPTTRSTSSCTAAPAPTSAARRPRCWTRWRASAATRA